MGVRHCKCLRKIIAKQNKVRNHFALPIILDPQREENPVNPGSFWGQSI